MEEQSLLFHIGPIWFDGTVAIMSALVCAIIFLIVFIWHNKDQQKVDTFETAQKQLLKQQRIADFSEEKVQEKRLYTVTFHPKNEKFTKEQP